MTEDERRQYAIAQRENCRPMECSLDAMCWVTVGGKAALEQTSMTRAPRCQACGGKLLTEQWRTPDGLRLSPHGRLVKHARPQGPVNREQAPRKGDSGAFEGANV